MLPSDHKNLWHLIIVVSVFTMCPQHAVVGAAMQLIVGVAMQLLVRPCS
jgi:hypothetical protein